MTAQAGRWVVCSFLLDVFAAQKNYPRQPSDLTTSS